MKLDIVSVPSSGPDRRGPPESAGDLSPVLRQFNRLIALYPPLSLIFQVPATLAGVSAAVVMQATGSNDRAPVNCSMNILQGHKRPPLGIESHAKSQIGVEACIRRRDLALKGGASLPSSFRSMPQYTCWKSVSQRICSLAAEKNSVLRPEI
jgi:hypothetical protein